MSCLFGLFLPIFLGLLGCVSPMLLVSFCRAFLWAPIGLSVRGLCLGFLALNRIVYFPTMDGYAFRGRYAQPDFVPAHIDDRDLDVVTNHD
jgi:hypothetical protein